jgi:nucleotide-binding universal stress UspA family protein
MYKNILVPLDGSSLSERVLPLARLFSKSFGCNIELVFVIPTPAEKFPQEITSLAEADADEYLRKISDSLSPSVGEAKLSYSVQNGYPATTIIEQAELKADTLILMSTRGFSGVQRLLLGSVAGKVVQAATMPVLLVPANAKSPEGELVELQRIIVPLDGSEFAECILPHAIELCKSLNIELILVRSYNPNFPGSSIRMHDVSQIVHDAAESYIQQKTEQMKAAGLNRVSYEVLRGQPAEQITDFAIETPNSLTAMCTHGRHGIGRWMLGSVTEAVIHCSEEPVLVVRGTIDKGD